ncbi:MAG: translocation/assembly module TamB [Treponema sp.]|jgi:hypothetical protein|nr:translocation/assembly module TamB [Treponema sp.]
MAVARDELLGRVETALGVRLEYASMAPSFYLGLDIRDIRLYAGGPEPLLSIGRLRLGYSLGGLLFGDYRLAIQNIRLDEPKINADMAYQEYYKAVFENLFGDGSGDHYGFFDLLPGSCRFRIRGGEFALRRGSDWVRAAVLNLNVRIQGGIAALQGRWSAESSAWDLSPYLPVPLAVSGSFTGSYDIGRRRGTLNGSIPGIAAGKAGEGIQFKIPRFSLDFDGENLSFDADLAGEASLPDLILSDMAQPYLSMPLAAEGHLAGSYHFPDRTLFLSGSIPAFAAGGPGEGFSLSIPRLSLGLNSDFLSFEADLEGEVRTLPDLGFPPYIQMPLTVSGSLDGTYDIPGRSGTVNAKIPVLSAGETGRGIDLRVFRAALGFDEETLNFDIELAGEARSLPGLELPSWLPLPLAASGRFTGFYDRVKERGAMDASIPSISAGDSRGGFTLRVPSLALFLEGETVRLEKKADPQPYELSLDYVPGTGALDLSFSGRGFSPEQILTFSGAWREYNRYLGMDTAGTLSFASGGQRETTYQMDLWGNFWSDFPLKNTTYVLKGTGNQDAILFERLELDFAPSGPIQGRAAYTGTIDLRSLAVQGSISLDGLSLSGRSSLSGDFSLSGSGGDPFREGFSALDLTEMVVGMRFNFWGEAVAVGDFSLEWVDLGLSFAEQGLDISLELRKAGGESRIAAEASLEYDPQTLELNLVLESLSTQDALDLVGPFAAIPELPELAFLTENDIQISTTMYVTTDFSRFSYAVSPFEAVYRGEQELSFRASISGTDRDLDLIDSTLAWPGGEADFSGRTDFSDSDAIVFSLEATFRDERYELEGTLFEFQTLELRGSDGIIARVSRDADGGYIGALEAASVPIPLENQTIRAAFQGSFSFDALDSWSLELGHLEVWDIATPMSPAMSIQASGTISQEGASFGKFSLDDGRGTLLGTVQVNWNFPGGEDYGAKVYLEDRRKREIISLEGTWEGGALDISLSGQELQLIRLWNGAGNALATGEARLRWNSQEDYSLDMSLTSLHTGDADGGFDLAVRAQVNPDRILLRDIRASYTGFRGAFPLVILDRLQSTAIVSEGSIQGPLLGQNIDLGLSARVQYVSLDSWLSIGEVLNNFRGSIHVIHAEHETLGSAEPFDLEFSRSASQISLNGGPNGMIRFRRSDGGTFFAALIGPSPIRGMFTGTVDAHTINAAVADFYLDMASLGKFMEDWDVQPTGGFIEASSLQIRGSLGDPEFFGNPNAHNIRLVVPYFLPEEIVSGSFPTVMSGNELSFGPIPVESGGGQASARGTFVFNRWIPSDYDIDILVPEATMVPVDYEYNGIRAVGRAWGNLGIAIEGTHVMVNGDLWGQNTEVTLDIQKFNAFGDEDRKFPEYPITVDLKLHTGRRVEFLFPSADLPILRAVAVPESALRIYSDDITGRYSVTGDIGLQSGEIFYFQRSFYVRSGTLSFNENEIQFSPRLSLRAEIHDRIDDGPVTISLISDNAPLLTFSPRFESDPPLSQVAIFSLLGQNMFGAGDSDQVGGMIVAGVDIWAQMGLYRQFEQWLRNALGLDVFSFRTQLLQNVGIQFLQLFNSNWTGNLLDNTTVLIGRYVGYDLYVYAMAGLRYDANIRESGGGWLTAPLLGVYYGLDMEAGFELESPLGNIGWNINFRHPENLFVDDMRFTLSWRFSF